MIPSVADIALRSEAEKRIKAVKVEAIHDLPSFASLYLSDPEFRGDVDAICERMKRST